MKRILFIAPHSFPIKSSESICNSKVAYALSEAGYLVDVYTCPDSNLYPDDITYDNLLRDSKNLSIYSIPQRNIFNRSANVCDKIKSILTHLLILLKTGYIYNGITIPYDILKHVDNRIRREGVKYDYMITRTFFTDLAGIYLSRKYQIKWIANWNDPYPLKRFPLPYGKGPDSKITYFEEKLLRNIAKYTTINTFPNERLRDYMLTYFNVNKSNTRIIPHMAMNRLAVNKKPGIEKFLKMVHCGNVKKPRDPELFIRALAEVVNSHEYSTFKFQCYFIGAYGEELPILIEQCGLKDKVFLLPGKTYFDSMNFISSCDVSIIIEAVCEEGIYLPTKVVDSFQSGKPIFCVSPTPGYLEDIVDKYNVGYYSNNTSLDSIKNQIIALFEDYKNDSLPLISSKNLKIFFEEGITEMYKNLFIHMDSM